MPQISMRTALWVALIGSVIFWFGIPWPVNVDFFEAETDAAVIAVVEENRGQFAIAFGLLGFGAFIAGIGLWMLGLAVAAAEGVSHPRRRRAAQIAAWLAVIGIVAGGSRAIYAVFGSAEANADSTFNFAIGNVGTVTTSVALLILGVLAWAGPPPKWTAVVLVLGGVLGAAMLLPLWWFLALIIFAIANLIVTRGERATGPSAAPTPAAG